MKWQYVIGLACVIFICCLYASIRNASIRNASIRNADEGFETRDPDKMKEIIANIDITGYMPRINNTKYNGIVSRIMDGKSYAVVYDATNTSELYVSGDRFPKDASNIQVGRHYDISHNYDMPKSIVRDDLAKSDVIRAANILRCVPDYDAKTRKYQFRSMTDAYFQTIDPILQIIGMGTDVLGTDVSGIAKGLWAMTITPEEAISQLAKTPKYREMMNLRPVDTAKFDKYGIYTLIRQIKPTDSELYDKLWNLDISGVLIDKSKNDIGYDSLKFPEYHEPAGDLKAEDTLPTYVRGANGQLVAMPWDDATYTSPFYDIRRKTSNYVPDYPETLYLSKFSLA
jgi:hypothetical protein